MNRDQATECWKSETLGAKMNGMGGATKTIIHFGHVFQIHNWKRALSETLLLGMMECFSCNSKTFANISTKSIFATFWRTQCMKWRISNPVKDHSILSTFARRTIISYSFIRVASGGKMIPGWSRDSTGPQYYLPKETIMSLLMAHWNINRKIIAFEFISHLGNIMCTPNLMRLWLIS